MAKSPIITVKVLSDIKGAVAGLDKVESKVGKFGQVAGKLAIAGGAVIGGALVAGIGSAMNANALEAKLAGALGLTEAQAAAAGDVAGRAYSNNFGGSLEETFKGVEIVKSQFASLNDTDLQGITESMLTVADVLEVDMESAVTTAGVLFTSGLADSAEEATDMITASLQKVPAAMRGDMLDAITEYGPFLDQLGFDGEHAIGMLTKAAAKGPFELDKMGDALKEFTIRSTDMSKASQEAYAAMGEDADAMAVSVLSGGKSANLALGYTVESLLAMEDPAEQAAAAIALFGAPLEDLGTDEIPGFLKSLIDTEDGMGSVAGSADALKDAVGDTLSAKLEGLKRRGIMALTTGLEGVLPHIEKGVDWLGKKLPGAIAAVQPKAEAVGRVLKNNIAPALVAIAVGTKDVVGKFVSMGEWISEHEPVLIGLGVAVGVVALAIGVSMVPAMIAWATTAGAAAAANILLYAPIVALVAVIAGLVAGVIYAYREVDWFRAAVDKVGDAFQWLWRDVLKPVAGWFTGTLVPIIRDKVIPVIGDIARVVGDIGGAIGGFAGTMAGWVLTVWHYGDMVLGFFRELPGKIGGFFGGLADTIAAPFKAAFNSVAGFWNRTVGSLSFKVPGWVPGLGGKGWDVPDIPTFHGGGIFGGPNEGLALLRRGEGVFTPDQMAVLGSHMSTNNNSGGNVFNITINGSNMKPADLQRMLVKMARDGKAVA